MSQVPTPVTPDFAKLMEATLKLGLSTLAEVSALSMKNGTLLTEMVNPKSALPALSQATSRALHAQLDIGLSSLDGGVSIMAAFNGGAPFSGYVG